MIRINENPTFLDRLNRGDSHFNVYSGSKNYVVDKISGDRYSVTPGKGFDKGADAYLKKITNSNGEVTKSALTNFIKMINKKMGYREDIDLESEKDDIINEFDDDSLRDELDSRVNEDDDIQDEFDDVDGEPARTILMKESIDEHTKSIVKLL